jgi:glutaredoxin 3
MPKIDIYTKIFCPYCTHALNLLESKSVNFNEIKIDGDNAMREIMIERAKGSYTVPQIFINDIHIGGCDDLVALDRSKKLDALLNV